MLHGQARQHLGQLVFFIFVPCLTFTKLASSVDLNNLAIWWPLPVNTALRYISLYAMHLTFRLCALNACAQAMTSLNCIDFVLKAVQYSHGSVDWLADGHGDQATKGVADACHCSNRTRSVKFAPHFAVLLLLQTHPCVDLAFLAHHFADSLRDALMELPARSMHRRFSLSCLPLTSQSVP